jgi:hypothetical protein
MNANLTFPTIFGVKAEDRSRQLVGAVVGLALGLLYSAVSGWINSILLWGVPLRLDVFGIILNTLSTGVGGAAAGYITAWPQSSFKGVLAGAGAIALFGVVKAFVVQSSIGTFGLTLILVTIFLPSVALSLPITVVLRFAVNKYQEALGYSGSARAARLTRLFGGVIILGILVGTFSQMTPTELKALREVNALVQAGLQGDLPASLQTIDHFAQRATGRYTLARSIDVSTDRSIAGSLAVETIKVLVQFESGLRFQCLVGSTLARPLCSES